jgi:photosystem II stability/assembly factor-like uncharacterized protein
MNSTAFFRYFIAALLLFSFRPSFAEWNWQNPRPQGNPLRAVTFTDVSNGWAAGEYGTILHTSNGGASWYEQEFARTDNILSISMTSAVEGWAAGDNGVILHTTDSGDDWLEQSSGVSGGLNSIFFLDSLNGWAAGDNEVILRTSDGGETWNIRHQIFNPTAVLNSIVFVSPTEGWAVGADRKVYHSTDGGSTWLARVVGSGVIASYLTVGFADPSFGFIAGTGGELYRTTDGGTTWPAVSSGVTGNLNQILVDNTFVSWMVGDGSKVLRTVNGGLSWSTTVIGDGEDYNGISRISGYLWAVGDVGKIIQSTNGGTAWSSSDAGSRLSANWIDFPSATVGVAVGQTGLILRTTDAGLNWSEQSSPSPSISCYGVKFTDQVHGWAVGDNGTILRTADGVNWSPQSSGVSHSLFGVTFGTPSAGWIVGGEAIGLTGVILNSTNGGSSWNVQLNGVPRILYGISFPDSQNGWAVGEQGYILRTTNGGVNWSAQTSGTAQALFWCSFPERNNGWAVGDSGVILHTTDGGSSWQPQSSGVKVALFSIAHVDSSEQYIAGDLGTILHTYDAGAHWKVEYSRTLHSLFGIATPGTGGVWASGDYGTVINDSLHSPRGTLTGLVYFDRDNNGTYNSGDSGMSGWRVAIAGAASDSTLTRPDGTFTFDDLPLGSYTLSERVRPSWTQTAPPPPGNYTVALITSAPIFSGSFGNNATGATGYHVSAGWNILSLPLIPDDPRASAVYPTAISPAYAYSSGYVILDTIRRGNAYWMRFPASQTLWLTGVPYHDDTLTLQSGWNMFGTISDSVSAATIATDPPGLIVSRIFGYNQGYATTSALAPGQGYWVKVSEGGSLFLHAGPVAVTGRSSSSPGFSPAPGDLSKLTVFDRVGNHQTLYFRTGGTVGPAIEHLLPPVPPAGCFDVRFQNNVDAVSFPQTDRRAGPAKILIHSAVSPLRFSWSLSDSDRTAYELYDESGRTIARIDGVSGTFVLEGDQVSFVVLRPVSGQSGVGLPASFSLAQNSPNPFNPTTHIRYSVPALHDDPASGRGGSGGSAGLVTLKIYDLLGREVATLVSETKEPGSYDAVWNATNIPSGVYAYRLTAGPNSAVRKMVLLK